MNESIQNEDVVQDTLMEAWDLFKDDFVLYVIAGLLVVVIATQSRLPNHARAGSSRALPKHRSRRPRPRRDARLRSVRARVADPSYRNP